MTDFLNYLCVFIICILILLAYIVRLDQKVDFERGNFNYDYNHLNALIDDFKILMIAICFIVVFIFLIS